MWKSCVNHAHTIWTSYGVANLMGNIETHENVSYITMLLISTSWTNTFQLVATSLYRIYLCVRVCNFVWTLVISNEPTFGNIMREGLIFQRGWHSRDLPMIIDWRDWNSWQNYQGGGMRRDEGGRRREDGGVEIQEIYRNYLRLWLRGVDISEIYQWF